MAGPRSPMLLCYLDKVVGFPVPRSKASFPVPVPRSPFRFLVPRSSSSFPVPVPRSPFTDLSQNQPIIHSYMQPVPFFHGGEQGRKRDLSTIVGFDQDQIQKPIRHHTTDVSSIGRSDLTDIESGTVTLSDIMEQLKKVSTKEDKSSNKRDFSSTVS